MVEKEKKIRKGPQYELFSDQFDRKDNANHYV